MPRHRPASVGGCRQPLGTAPDPRPATPTRPRRRVSAQLLGLCPCRTPQPDQRTLGRGAVAIFDEDGNFIKELISGDRLAAPWEIALAPPSFGRFASHLLVGNTGASRSAPPAFLRAAFGQSILGSAATTAVLIPSTSPTGSTAKRTGCSVPFLPARVRRKKAG